MCEYKIVWTKISNNGGNNKKPHSYDKWAYISNAIILNTNTLNYHYCLDIDDVRILKC